VTIELVPGTTNVVRLPSAGRTDATLDLLREIAPEVREVSLIADAYGVAMPSDDLRQRVDAETAEYILNQVDPQPGPARTAALRELLRPLLVVAVSACRDARIAAAISAEAQRRLALAKADGGYWITPLTERATDLATPPSCWLLPTFPPRKPKAPHVLSAWRNRGSPGCRSISARRRKRCSSVTSMRLAGKAPHAVT
jgi:hypothetical protein